MGKSDKFSVEGLDRSPAHLLHRALQLALDLYAGESGPGAVTQRQYAVLAAVAAHEGLTQTDLVRATGIDRSTLADMIARMTKRGLLARERSANDARANQVTLSEAGRVALDAVQPHVHAADEKILALIPSAKRQAFVAILRDLAKAGEVSLTDKGPETVKANAPKADKAHGEKKKRKDKKDKKAKKAKKASANLVAE